MNLLLRTPETFHPYIRSITTTGICRKQPPLDRHRYTRLQQHPRHRVPFVDEFPLNHLPVKPSTAVGAWGSTEAKLKALRFKQGETLKQLPTMFDKIQELYHYENNLWYHTLDVPLQCYGSLDFVKHLTRTNIQPLGTHSTKSSSIHAQITDVINEELCQLNRRPVNKHDQRPEAVEARSKQRALFIASIMEASYMAWIKSHPNAHQLNQPHQVDEGACVEAFFKRRIPAEVFENPKDVAEDVFDEVNDTIWDSNEETVRYRIRSRLAWQLRGSKPLQPFLPIDHPDCMDNGVPQCTYRPEAFDLKPIDCLRFSCLPRADTQKFSEFARSVAGYWSHTPFWPGDPCEFGHMGALNTVQNEGIHQDIGTLNQPDEVKHEARMLHGLCEAILTAFAWTSAQAYNTGFTMYNELTYPFPVQLLLFENDYVQLVRYQLNSLTSLWKADDAGLPSNMAWYSPKLQLFRVDPSSNHVSVDPQAVSLIAEAFSYPTVSNISEDSLRPFLSRPKQVDDSETWLIPDSPTGKDTEDPEASLLSKLEEEAQQARKDQSSKYPVRLHTPKAPHPNEVYYLKTTEKSDIVAEFMEEMPSFGGQFSKLPEADRVRLKKWMLERRDRLPRSRVQPPPRRWR